MAILTAKHITEAKPTLSTGSYVELLEQFVAHHLELEKRAGLIEKVVYLNKLREDEKERAPIDLDKAFSYELVPPTQFISIDIGNKDDTGITVAPIKNKRGQGRGNPLDRLLNEEIEAILKSNLGQVKLAKHYGISQPQVSMIKTGKYQRKTQ